MTFNFLRKFRGLVAYCTCWHIVVHIFCFCAACTLVRVRKNMDSAAHDRRASRPLKKTGYAASSTSDIMRHLRKGYDDDDNDNNINNNIFIVS